MINRIKINIVLILAVFMLIITRLPFIGIPILMGDEAQIISFGGKVLSGAIYAIDLVDTRGPASYYVGALISYLFGYGNMVAFHIIGYIFQIIILLLIYYLASSLYDNLTGQIAALFYAIFSFAYIVHDTVAFNVEIISMPFLLSSAIIYKKIINNNKNTVKNIFMCIICGFLCSLVFATKQVIASVLIAYIIFAIYKALHTDIKSFYFKVIGFISVGFLLGLISVFSHSIKFAGIYNTIYWLFFFAYYHYNTSLWNKIIIFIQRITLLYINQPLIWTLVILWFVKSIFQKNNQKTIGINDSTVYLLLLILAQCFGAIIAGSVAGHYIIPIIALISIAGANITNQFINQIDYSAKKAFCVFLLIMGIIPPTISFALFPEGIQVKGYSIRDFYQEKLWQENPLNDSIDYIKNNLKPGERIYVLGGLYEIYAQTRCLPGTVTLALGFFRDHNEDPFLQKTYERIINYLKTDPPKIIVWPCENYGGIGYNDLNFIQIIEILKDRYHMIKHFEWESKLKFLRGKTTIMKDGNEWIDIYLLNK
jgi:hypothetical protein